MCDAKGRVVIKDICEGIGEVKPQVHIFEGDLAIDISFVSMLHELVQLFISVGQAQVFELCSKEGNDELLRQRLIFIIEFE